MKRLKSLGTSPLCLISAILWGVSFPMQDMASKNAHLLDALGFNGIRFILASITLLPLVLIFERRSDYSKKRVCDTMIFGILAGAVLAFASLLQQIGIEKTGESGKAGFITSMYLVFVPILALVFFKQKCSKIILFSICISVAGLYFLSVPRGAFTVATGDLYVLACALMFAIHIIVLDAGSKRTNPMLFSFIQFLTAGAISIIFALFFGKITIQGVEKTIIPILFCGILSCGAAYTLQLLGQRRAPASLCALFCSTESLFAVLFECIIEGTNLSGRAILGCALMFAAVIVAQISPVKEIASEK